MFERTSNRVTKKHALSCFAGFSRWIVLCAVCVAIALLLSAVFIGRRGGLGFLFEYRVHIRLLNPSATDCDVLSTNTNQVAHVPSGAVVDIPHGGGDVLIRRADGKVWRYSDVWPLELKGSPYCIRTHYPVPFGGSWFAATMALAEDGRLYAIRPGERGLDAAQDAQPPGFPLVPASVNEFTSESSSSTDASFAAEPTPTPSDPEEVEGESR